VVFDPAARGSQAFIAFAEELVAKMPPASAFAPSAPPVAAPIELLPDTLQNADGPNP
jgi:chromosome partitioning protein